MREHLRVCHYLAIAACVAALALLPGCGGDDNEVAAAGADVVTPQAVGGASATADTFLQASTPNTGYGTKTPLSCGGTANKAARALMKFGSISLPAGAMLQKAEMQLFVKAASGSDTYKVHAVTTAWTEAAATWATHATAYGATALTSRTISAANRNKVVAFDITEAVRGWIADPATNNGVLIRGSETGASCSLCSREEKNTSRRPKLALTYTTSSGLKNIIVMISDGCGYNHVEAGSLYQHGTAAGWAYQSFPVKLGMSTYPDGGSYDPAQAWSNFSYVTVNPTDSAAAATAMACGVKTYNAAIGVGPGGATVQNILEAAEGKGKSSGVVSSVPFSHATPAGFLVHNADRNNYLPIADSEAASRAEVVMGAGNPNFTDSGAPRAATYQYLSSTLWSGLTAGTVSNDCDGDGVADPWKLIQTRAEFEALTSGTPPKRIFGVPQVASTLQEGRGGTTTAPAFSVPFNANVPDLSTMSLGALNVLSQDPDGLCIMIEGGAIDWAAHSNLSGRMIEEEIDFSRAVDSVIHWVESHSNWDETLLIVTGDHECGYLTGPGSGAPATWNPLLNNGAGQMPGMEWHSGSHTNSLIPLFAKGAASSRLLGYPQSTDSRRGAYVDNIYIARTVFDALQ